jgi:hypothetical protein
MIPATWANIPKTTNARSHQFGRDKSTAGNAHYVNIPGQRGPARPACCVSHGSTRQDTPPPPRSPALTGKVDARHGRVGREGLPQRRRPRVSDAVLPATPSAHMSARGANAGCQSVSRPQPRSRQREPAHRGLRLGMTRRRPRPPCVLRVSLQHAPKLPRHAPAPAQPRTYRKG